MSLRHVTVRLRLVTVRLRLVTVRLRLVTVRLRLVTVRLRLVTLSLSKRSRVVELVEARGRLKPFFPAALRLRRFAPPLSVTVGATPRNRGATFAVESLERGLRTCRSFG
jgi:hypothetical protein